MAEASIAEVQAAIDALRSDVDAYEADLAAVHAQQDRLAKEAAKAAKALKEAKAAAKAIKGPARAAALDSVKRVEADLKRRTANLPRPHAWFLSLFLGKSLNTVLFRKSERLKYKQEYEEFKLKATYNLVGFAVLLLVWPMRVFLGLFHLLLLYYYVAVTLREHVLKNNGSSIKGWWIFHHYLTMILTCTLLTWPYGDSYRLFQTQFIYYSLFAGLVQFLQYRYQTARLYALIALEKANSMDVVNTDSAAIRWHNSMSFLFPFLIAGQLFQLCNAHLLLSMALDGAPEFQVLISGILFSVLGVGNLATTIRVVVRKLSEGRQGNDKPKGD